jgi:hypothetical protein
MFGKMLAALDIQENRNNKESHILNEFSRRKIYTLYLTLFGECWARAEKEPKDKDKRQVTALLDKSESEGELLQYSDIVV